ncbi:hypothetical protein B296_00006723 [Ensete ventricosum]|uniref:Uncharacterized protein n=1 Tax=Ensete ventricosum TaxID=4639 RepID=A0A426YV08_ENSVE|nr:hypothetical protein B296_00006723 [Ensete ventricosum]
MIGAAGELDYFSAQIRLREPDKSKDKAEYTNVATKEAKENRIGTSPATRKQRPYIGVAVYLSIDQGGLLGGHSGIEAGMIGATEELDYFSTHIHLREPGKSKDKAE